MKLRVYKSLIPIFIITLLFFTYQNFKLFKRIEGKRENITLIKEKKKEIKVLSYHEAMKEISSLENGNINKITMKDKNSIHMAVDYSCKIDNIKNLVNKLSLNKDVYIENISYNSDGEENKLKLELNYTFK